MRTRPLYDFIKTTRALARVCVCVFVCVCVRMLRSRRPVYGRRKWTSANLYNNNNNNNIMPPRVPLSLSLSLNA
jgi:hypothetical protein